ncbi:SCO4225 family membrane protein [Streptomyces sp. NPDC059913]|uniref:SCO4225 family membrane protein n=1 Tax=unclassified Streptomyces TaxID=2593676 RepID=UPI00332FCAE7
MNVRALVRMTFCNAASAVYLGIVAAAFVFELAVVLFGDPGMVGVWPVLLTAPTSLVVVGAAGAVWGTGASAWFLFVAPVVGALVQSFALGALWSALRGRRGRMRPAQG